MTTQAHPYSITAPSVMTVAPNSSGSFQVINSGTQPIHVHESLGRYSEHAIQYPAADHATLKTMQHPWLSVREHDFTLAPGHAETVHVTSHVPAGAQGNHYLNMIWTASPVHAAAGPLHLAGAVATNVTIPLAGTAVPVTGQGMPHATPAPHHGGLSMLDFGGIGLAVVLIVTVVLAMVRRTRAGRRAEA